MNAHVSLAPVAIPAVNHATLGEQVCALLRERILSNALPPGTVLREGPLAAELSVSRVPVREALRQLASEGLVDLVPRHGAIVSSLSVKQFLDAYRVREALEALAVRLATPLLDEADHERLRELERIMEACAAAADTGGFFAANVEFHRLLVERSGNERLVASHAPLVAQMRRYQSPSIDMRGGLEQSLQEHRAILEALFARDAEAAARLMGQHIRQPQERLEAMAASGVRDLPLRTAAGTNGHGGA